MLGLAAGVWLRRQHPFPAEDPLLRILERKRPEIHKGIRYVWTGLEFSTPILALISLGSMMFIFGGSVRRKVVGKLPSFPAPGEKLEIVLGEVHHPTKPGPSEAPSW